jgi:hypothetical protein
MRCPAFLPAIAALCLTVLAAGAGRADPVIWYDPGKVTDLSFGIFCPRAPDRKTEASNALHGTANVYDEIPALLRQTQTIPAIDGAMFGVRFRFQTRSATKVLLRVDHPPLGPDWKRVETWTHVWDHDEMTFYNYTLDLGDGDSKGLWTLSGTREGRNLFRVEFEVTDPSPAALAEQKQCNLKQVS